MENKVFISGALTDISNPDHEKHKYERIGHLCEEKGLQAYLPHTFTDPDLHAHVSAQEVYKIDRYHVATSCLVIAFVDIPSLGVGQEIEIAQEHGVPTILVHHRDNRLSRMTRGSPGIVTEIRYHDLEDAIQQLSVLLDHEDIRWGEVLDVEQTS